MAIDPVIIGALAPAIGIALVAWPVAWVGTTWLRVRNGYPLESSWGKPLFPQLTSEAMERVKLLDQENAQLRAQLGSVRDRLEVLERIATDPGKRLASEIDALNIKSLN